MYKIKEGKEYIIRAEYGTQMPYYIGWNEKNRCVFMDKLRAYNITDPDFGYSLDEAKQIMKMYKVEKKKIDEKHNEFLNEFTKAGLYRPNDKPFCATKFYIRKKSKLKNEIEKTRFGNGEYGWKFKDTERL